jgi:hypothetical protein
MKRYGTRGKVRIGDREQLSRLLDASRSSHYVYVLCKAADELDLEPFYVGIGQGDRVFAHETEASETARSSRKLDQIRALWKEGREVIRVLDSTYQSEPWQREEELINEFGLLKDGTGVLTNEQRYAESRLTNGVELRKYAFDGNELPKNFIRRDTRLKVGPEVPKSTTSVYGKICAVLIRHPGVTGAELVELLLKVNFSQNKSAYTSAGAVSRPWLAKYIDGGFYQKNRCIQEY